MTAVDYANIELLVLDVDGVLTDGRIVLTSGGEEVKCFHVRDGSGIKYWRRAGRKVALVSGRGSPAVLRRAEELDVDAVRLNATDKLPAMLEVLEQLGIPAGKTAAVGDDLPDLPMLRHCAFPIAVADAVEAVRQEALYVTEATGGRGAVREAVELILKKAGAWDRIMARYLPSAKEGDR